MTITFSTTKRFYLRNVVSMRKFFLFWLLALPFGAWAESPIKFIPNQGQWAPNILAEADLAGGRLYIEKDGLVFSFFDLDAYRQKHKERNNPDFKVPGHTYKIHFQNSSGATHFSSKNEWNEALNYYLGERKGEDVRPVGEMTLHNIYTNIDLQLLSEGGFLKYNLVLHPGADASNIEFRFEGATPKKGGQGTLIIPTSVNLVQENKPIAFEVQSSGNKELPCQFQVEGNSVRFKLKGKSITSTTRIIDPLLLFSTYSGSKADNWGYTATYDRDGNAFGGGIVFFQGSLNPNGYPTLGPIQNVFQGGQDDIVISKFIQNGSALGYSTYIGGNASDQPTSLVTDTAGNLYILGRSSSGNFPKVARCYDTSHNGMTDVVVLKISAQGRLLSSSYVGGNGEDGVNGASIVENNNPNFLNYNYGDNQRGEIVLDDSGHVFVATSTRSANFPVSNSFDLTYGGLQDGVVFRMDSNLTRLVWSGYVGGTAEDAVYSIFVHDDSSIFISGGTKSSDFPTTPNVIATTSHGGMEGYICRILKNGRSISRSTYIGTSAYDQVFFVRADGAGSIYYFAQTEGNIVPTPGCYNQGNSKQWVGKVNPNLDTLVWQTAFGSGNQLGPNLSPTAFEVDSCGRIYLAGWGGRDNQLSNNRVGRTYDLPLKNAFQTTTDSSDFYLMALGQNASSLLFGSYFGGNSSADHVDGGTSRFDQKGIMYHSVCASCGTPVADFPTTPGAWSRRDSSGNCNMVVFKFDFRSAALIRAGFEIDSTKALCPPVALKPKNTSIGPNTLKYLWTFTSGTNLRTDTAFEPQFIIPFPGYYTLKLVVWDSAGGPCSNRDSLSVVFRIKDKVLDADFFANGNLTRCAPLNITYLANCTGAGFNTKYIWYQNGDSVSNLPNPTLKFDTSGAYVVRLVAIDSSTCNIVDSLDQNLRLSSIKQDILPAAACFCKTDSTLKLEPSITGKDYEWSGAGSGSNPLIKPDQSGIYILKMKDSLDCEQIDSIDVLMNECGKELYNVITPNGDGANDEFQPIPNADQPDDYLLVIFNRWGQVVFRSKNHKEAWKGDSQLSGGALYDSSYFFDLKATYCNGFKVEKSGLIKLVK